MGRNEPLSDRNYPVCLCSACCNMFGRSFSWSLKRICAKLNEMNPIYMWSRLSFWAVTHHIMLISHFHFNSIWYSEVITHLVTDQVRLYITSMMWSENIFIFYSSKLQNMWSNEKREQFFLFKYISCQVVFSPQVFQFPQAKAIMPLKRKYTLEVKEKQHTLELTENYSLKFKL